jgi:hypothetical protein
MIKFLHKREASNLASAKEAMSKMFLILESRNETDGYAAEYLRLAQILEHEMAILGPEEISDNKMKSGHYYQLAFKLDSNLQHKVIKHYSSKIREKIISHSTEITSWNLISLFNLHKLVDFSSILKLHIQRIVSTQLFTMDLTNVAWYPTVFRSFFFINWISQRNMNYLANLYQNVFP